MLGRVWPRLTVEIGFLCLVAFLAGAFDFSVAGVALVMTIAWLLVSGVELLAARERPSEPAAPIASEPQGDGEETAVLATTRGVEAEAAARPTLEPLEPRPARRWPWERDVIEAEQEPTAEEPAVAAVEPAVGEDGGPPVEAEAPEQRAEAEIDEEEIAPEPAADAPLAEPEPEVAAVAAENGAGPQADEVEAPVSPQLASDTEPGSAAPAPVLAAVPSLPAEEPEPGLATEPEGEEVERVVDFPASPSPREWNIWELERLVRERGGEDPARDEEWAYLLVYLREFASADGLLPVDFDGLVRESFGEFLGAARAR